MLKKSPARAAGQRPQMDPLRQNPQSDPKHGIHRSQKLAAIRYWESLDHLPTLSLLSTDLLLYHSAIEINKDQVECHTFSVSEKQAIQRDVPSAVSLVRERCCAIGHGWGVCGIENVRIPIVTLSLSSVQADRLSIRVSEFNLSRLTMSYSGWTTRLTRAGSPGGGLLYSSS